MPSPIDTLPRVLLQALGRSGLQEKVQAAALARQDAVAPLLQHHHGAPYVVSADRGLDLMLQCTTPEAAEGDRLWGLHSFTLHAGEWAGPWPEGLNPATATAQEVVRLFAPDPETTLCTPAMVCFTITGQREAQLWSVLCQFDSGSRQLQSFTLARTGEWLSADEDPPVKLA
jgi:hypothetical protein